MAGIRAKNTKPEMLVRRGLHALGHRYRLHDRQLPGSPDIVFRQYRTAVFIHGCFWHGHECPTFRWPKTRASFWKKKISANRARDQDQVAELVERGWGVCVVWECQLRRKNPDQVANLLTSLSDWITQRKTPIGHGDDPRPFEIFPGGGDENPRGR